MQINDLVYGLGRLLLTENAKLPYNEGFEPVVEVYDPTTERRYEIKSVVSQDRNNFQIIVQQAEPIAEGVSEAR